MAYSYLHMKEIRSEAAKSPRLDSWKEIAGYLNRGVRTVRRWEVARGLPVHRVPGGGKPGVYALKSELDGWWKRVRVHLVEEAHGAAPESRTPSVAVLPFANLTADKGNEYFSDGLADEIITALTRVPGLRVTARTSSFTFRGKEQDIRKIGGILGVSTLLEGSVQRAAGRIRVSAQLVCAVDGYHLWSQSYDRDLADVFAIQDEISAAIARALEVRLTPSRTLPRTANLDAYNYWLQGRYYQQYENMEALAKCRNCLERAIALDPRFPQPYLGLAGLARSVAQFGVIRPRDAIAQGWAAIRKAFELDDSLAEGYALSGAYRAWMDFDWSGAGADFDRALELSPASAETHRLRATHYLVPTGRLREAEEEMERAVASDPVSPLMYVYLGEVLLWERQFDRGLAKMETAFELRPDYALGLWYRGAALYFQGRLEEGLMLFQSALQKVGPNPVMIGGIGMTLAQLGRQAEARAALAQLQAADRERYTPPLAHAQIHLALGDTDAAFEWLDRAVEERDPHIFDLPCKPIWDAIRADPRFTALLHKMRLS